MIGSWDDLPSFGGRRGSIIALLKGLGTASDAVAVTPNDTTDLSKPARAIYVGSTGDVKLTAYGGGTVVFKAVPAGVTIPVCTKRVFLTGTTATNLVALL